jgi:formylglycine-generating enzyme required for sulfatase activity
MGKLRSKTGLAFDLPTEAQWENACRAGSSLALNIGENNSSVGVALIQGSEKLDPTATHYLYVGNYMPNALGLYDMQGGVSEWCLDAYRDNLGGADVVDPDGGAPVISSITLLNSSSDFNSNPDAANLGGASKAKVVFDGKTYFTYTNDNSNQFDYLYVGYTGYKSTRVVRGGGVRAVYRTSATSMNTSGAIFVEGVKAGRVTKKAAFTNPTHGVRVALTVDE